MRAFLLFALVISTAADAAETITYTYDARGRLKQVVRAGSVNNGATATYTLDKADNRTNVSVTAGGGGGMAMGTPAATPNNKTEDRGGGNDAAADR